MIRALVYFEARVQALRYGAVIHELDFELPYLRKCGRWALDYNCTKLFRRMMDDKDHVFAPNIVPQMEDLHDGQQDMALDPAENDDDADADAPEADPTGSMMERVCKRARMNTWS